jgi:carbon-monoxide dehydrogenase small subunit
MEVRTIEGFETDEVMADLRKAFSREHALQCGFCTPGMLITARDIVLRCPDADEKRVRVELSGNLCRCTGYQGIVNAVLSVVEARRSATATPPVPAAPPSAFRAFQPAAPAVPAPAPAAAAVAAPAGSAAGKKPGTLIEDEFVVEHPLERVWAAFADMPGVVACLPGAEISEHTPNSIKGRITTRFGPMRAAFNGAASLERDEAAKRGAIRGAGTDMLSASRARGDITYALAEAGPGRTRVTVGIEYSLQGPLAQFSRGGLVKEFVKKMVADFAANLNARLGTAALAGDAAPAEGTSAAAPVQLPAKPAEFDAGGFFWRWLWSRIRALFRR